MKYVEGLSDDNKPVVVSVLSNRNQFQIFLMVMLIVAGVVSVFFTPTTGSANALMPHWIRAVWGGGLILGSLINLLAIFVPWKSVLTELRIEMLSLVVLAASTSVFAYVAIFNVFHIPATYRPGTAGYIIIPLAVAYVWRFVHLLRADMRIRRLHALSREP